MKKIVKFLTIVLTFSLLPLSSIEAASLNLSLSPPILQATIKPGKSISQVFTIYNNSPNPIKLTPRIIPFWPEDDQGNPSLRPQSKPAWLSYFSLANSKISLNHPFVLPANQKDQLILNIKIPENAPFKDHYATLLVSSNSPASGQGNAETSPKVAQQIITGSIGANILLTVANQAAPPTILKLIDLEPANTRFLKIGQLYILDNLSPIQFTAKLENLGQHLTQAHGLFQIHQKDKISHIQPTLPVNVLAQSIRQITASPSGRLEFNPKITSIGRYQASLNIRSENGSTQSSISLILLPIKAGIGLVLGIILLKSILTVSQTSSRQKSQTS